MKYIIHDFIHRRISEKISSGVFSAQVIFVYIPGFTNLTETLMKQGVEGAEILLDITGKVFLKQCLVSAKHKHNSVYLSRR